MSTLMFDCYCPSHQEHSIKKEKLRVSSSSGALVIVSLNVEGGSWEAEDLQELKERLESREFTAASKMSGLGETAHQLKCLVHKWEEQS